MTKNPKDKKDLQDGEDQAVAPVEGPGGAPAEGPSKKSSKKAKGITKVSAVQNNVAEDAADAVNIELEIDKKEKAHEAELIKRCVKNGTLDNFELRTALSLGTEHLRDFGEDPNDMERSLDAVGALNKRGNYSRLLMLLAEKYCTSQSSSWGRNGFSDWSHALCHTFEKYGRGGKSLLDSKHNQESCTKLIDEAVKRAMDFNYEGCIHRIVSPVMQYNMDQADLDDLEQKLAYRPESLTHKNFIPIHGANPFLMTDNYRDLFAGLVRNDLNKAKDDWYRGSIPFKMPKLVELLKKLGPALSEEEKDQYLTWCAFGRGTNDRTTLVGCDKAIQLAESATETIDEVCVDVDGTLVSYDPYEKKEKLNKNLVETLIKLMGAGRKVTVFTGGSPKVQAERLAAFGADKRLLNVKSKAGYQGKAVDIVIDDTLPEIQGIKALNYIKPFAYGEWFDKKGRVPAKEDGEDED